MPLYTHAAGVALGSRRWPVSFLALALFAATLLGPEAVSGQEAWPSAAPAAAALETAPTATVPDDSPVAAAPTAAAPTAVAPAALPSIAEVNGIDRLLMFSYSAPLDTASDYSQYAAFLSPALFALVAPPGEWLGIGAMYAGSAVLAYTTRTALKALIDRKRPYMYFDQPSAELIAKGDHVNSFPSGHAIMAFTGAGFTATVFCLRYPDSPYRLPVVAGAYGLATLTLGLRLGSGSHFISDVAAGAAIGSLFGVLVPLGVDLLSTKR